MPEHVAPVIPSVPRDSGGRVDLDGHNLADVPTLNENHRTADAAALAAAILTTMDVRADEWVIVGDIRPRDDVCRLDHKSVACYVRSYTVRITFAMVRTCGASPVMTGGN